jgi:hypothetical protein
LRHIRVMNINFFSSQFFFLLRPLRKIKFWRYVKSFRHHGTLSIAVHDSLSRKDGRRMLDKEFLKFLRAFLLLKATSLFMKMKFSAQENFNNLCWVMRE